MKSTEWHRMNIIHQGRQVGMDTPCSCGRTVLTKEFHVLGGKAGSSWRLKKNVQCLQITKLVTCTLVITFGFVKHREWQLKRTFLWLHTIIDKCKVHDQGRHKAGAVTCNTCHSCVCYRWNRLLLIEFTRNVQSLLWAWRSRAHSGDSKRKLTIP